MAKIEYYRLVDDAEECRYIGTFDNAGNEGGKHQTADALARFGVSLEVARKVINALENDYIEIDRDQPICCAEHERFLTSLIEAAAGGSPVRPVSLPGHRLH